MKFPTIGVRLSSSLVNKQHISQHTSFSSFDKEMDDLEDNLSSKISADHVSKIGQGSFGDVYLIKEKIQFKVVKRVDLANCPAKDKAVAVEEALILSRLRHPNVLSIIDFFMEGKYL